MIASGVLGRVAEGSGFAVESSLLLGGGGCVENGETGLEGGEVLELAGVELRVLGRGWIGLEWVGTGS